MRLLPGALCRGCALVVENGSAKSETASGSAQASADGNGSSQVRCLKMMMVARSESCILCADAQDRGSFQSLSCAFVVSVVNDTASVGVLLRMALGCKGPSVHLMLKRLLQEDGEPKPGVWIKNNRAGKAAGRRRLKEALRSHKSWKPFESAKVLRFTDQPDATSGTTAPQASTSAVHTECTLPAVLASMHCCTLLRGMKRC